MCERLTELILGAEDTRFDGAKRQVERGSDFIIGKFMLVAESDQQFVIGIQLIDRFV